ncbi:hypothetical protein [Paenibacillus terrae]|uniref:hypothetical protein n=1 Tax=Paenibacillus terrae TaxID=159743 RepID=UPI0002D71EEB|nr:hypothetical protein [Paenibacillus terrae]
MLERIHSVISAPASGDKKSISKKQALLRRQNINKRNMEHTSIQLPQEAFNSILDINIGND